MDERKKIEEPVAVEFESFKSEFRNSLQSDTPTLRTATEKIFESTGKHIRPLLVLLTAKACGNVSDNTINVAFLNYSLLPRWFMIM